MLLYFRDIQTIAVMEKHTEDVVRRSVGDMRVAAVVTVMTAEGIHQPASTTCLLDILGDVRADGNEYISHLQHRGIMSTKPVFEKIVEMQRSYVLVLLCGHTTLCF